MDQSEIIRIAREAGLLTDECNLNIHADCYQLERFAALVAEATKEKAAKVCDGHKGWFGYQIAAAIRSMK